MGSPRDQHIAQENRYWETDRRNQGLGRNWGSNCNCYLFSNAMGNYTEFRTHTGDPLDVIGTRLDKIDKGILELRASQSPNAVLHEINGMNQTKFSASLPALQSAIQKPIPEIATSQPLLDGIAEKLLKTNSSAPNYWPTVLQFLQFASAGLAPANVPPPDSKPTIRTSGISNLFANNVFSRVTVILDGGLLIGNRFENCRVIFTDTPVQMTNVTFVNSIFEFPISSEPPPYIQKAGKLLLASDLKTASIPNL